MTKTLNYVDCLVSTPRGGDGVRFFSSTVYIFCLGVAQSGRVANVYVFSLGIAQPGRVGALDAFSAGSNPAIQTKNISINFIFD